MNERWNHNIKYLYIDIYDETSGIAEIAIMLRLMLPENENVFEPIMPWPVYDTLALGG